MIPVSILDQTICGRGLDPAAALRDTVALARMADRLGYARFWMSEHHSNPGIVGTAPEIMTAAIAASTERIRVGAAGVMLPHYSPFKVAEQWKVLEALAPRRIDLALGRSPGDDPVAAALSQGRAAEGDFDADVEALIGWLGDDRSDVWAFPPGHPAPRIWMLVSSSRGAALAARLGLPIAYNYSDKGEETAGVLAAYRDAFRPSSSQARPYVVLSVWALTADDPAVAEHAFWSRTHWRVRLWDKERIAMAPPDEAAAHPYTAAERARIADWRRHYFVGEAERIALDIEATAARYGADEILAVTWTHDPALRLRSFELLAQAFDLNNQKQLPLRRKFNG